MEGGREGGMERKKERELAADSNIEKEEGFEA